MINRLFKDMSANMIISSKIGKLSLVQFSNLYIKNDSLECVTTIVMICIAMQLSYQFFFSYLYFMNMYGANLLFNKLYKVSLSWYNTSGKGFMFRRLQICQHTIGNKSLLGQLILSISLYIIYSYVYPFFSTLTFTLDC